MQAITKSTCLDISNNYEKGANSILKLNPDITFIDLDMTLKDKSCFEFVKEFLFYKETLPKFIGISRGTDLAYLCLKNNFYDYILYPLNEFELRKSVMRFEKDNRGISKMRLCLKSNSDYHYIKLDDILYLQADNNSTDIFLSNGSKIAAFETLKKFENKLPEAFIRTHNSYIVNSRLINRVNFGKNKISLAGFENLINIPLSKKYRDDLMSFNKKILENRLSTLLN
ncbi:LytR/AlgR family response regulator transcription factor [Christiangramia gaetbulicola]|nr:LytTR family transcriptional regulator DNA-binding domain-containing protein [Christiangramia gaetbulicola]